MSTIWHPRLEMCCPAWRRRQNKVKEEGFIRSRCWCSLRDLIPRHITMSVLQGGMKPFGDWNKNYAQLLPLQTLLRVFQTTEQSTLGVESGAIQAMTRIICYLVMLQGFGIVACWQSASLMTLTKASRTFRGDRLCSFQKRLEQQLHAVTSVGNAQGSTVRLLVWVEAATGGVQCKG